jgi:hypothetical protein
MMLVEIGFAWELQRGGRKRRLGTTMTRESGAAAEEGLQLLQDTNDEGADQVHSGALTVEKLHVKRQRDLKRVQNPSIDLQGTTGDNSDRKPPASTRNRNGTTQALVSNGYDNQGSHQDMEGAHRLVSFMSSAEGSPYAAANITPPMGSAPVPSSQSASSTTGKTWGLGIALSQTSQRNASLFHQQRLQHQEVQAGFRQLLSLETPFQSNAHAALNSYNALRMAGILDAMQQRQQQHSIALLSQTRPQEHGGVAFPRAQQLPYATTRNLSMIQWPAIMHANSGRIHVAPTSVTPSLVERGTGASRRQLLSTMIASLNNDGIGNRYDAGSQLIVRKDQKPPPGGTN